MLTIGAPGFIAFLLYFIIAGAMLRFITGLLIKRNPDSNLAGALAFIH